MKDVVNRRRIICDNEGILPKNQIDFRQKEMQKLNPIHCTDKDSVITYCISEVFLLFQQIQNKPKLNTKFFQTSQAKASKFNFTVLLATETGFFQTFVSFHFKQTSIKQLHFSIHTTLRTTGIMLHDLSLKHLATNTPTLTFSIINILSFVLQTFYMAAGHASYKALSIYDAQNMHLSTCNWAKVTQIQIYFLL